MPRDEVGDVADGDGGGRGERRSLFEPLDLSSRGCGETALEKPSLAASFRRACSWATGRIAPDSPISPK